MTELNILNSLVGGAIIGVAAICLFAFNGKIAGISGILYGIFRLPKGDIFWRVMFVGGLLIGGFFFQLLTQQSLVTREGFSVWQLILAGLLVGIGTQLGSGCTSGHGVCGIGRLSPRSIVATCVFVGVGMLTATLLWLFFVGQVL